MTTAAEVQNPPQWLAYVADVARDPERDAACAAYVEASDADPRRTDPRYALEVGVLAGRQQGLLPGIQLWVCLPREQPPMTTLAERAHAWLSPAVQWAATLVVTAAGEGWARCRVVALNLEPPEMDFGVQSGMRVYAPKWEG